MLDSLPGGSPRFHTTRWSLVISTQGGEPAAQAALSELCELYWYPLYAFLRQGGRRHADALDLVHGFLAGLLERGGALDPEPDRGRFRSYLLGAMKHYVANERRHAGAQRRGGGVQFEALTQGEAEGRYGREPGHVESPERLYQRSWAVLVLDRAMQRLETEYAERGRGRQFEVLRDTLDGDMETRSHAERAAELGTSEGALRVAVHRLRARLRELVRDEIGQTVAGAEDVEAELQALFEALSAESENRA